MYNLNENYFSKQKMLEIHYKKTANIVGIFATSRLVTFSHLVTLLL